MPADVGGLSLEETTMAQKLKDVGYYTHKVGKNGTLVTPALIMCQQREDLTHFMASKMSLFKLYAQRFRNNITTLNLALKQNFVAIFIEYR